MITVLAASLILYCFVHKKTLEISDSNLKTARSALVTGSIPYVLSDNPDEKKIAMAMIKLADTELEEKITNLIIDDYQSKIVSSFNRNQFNDVNKLLDESALVSSYIGEETLEVFGKLKIQASAKKELGHFVAQVQALRPEWKHEIYNRFNLPDETPPANHPTLTPRYKHDLE